MVPPPDTAFEQALLSLDRVGAREQLVEARSSRGSAIHLIEQVVVPTLERMGKRWEQGELALAQVFMAGRICEELLEELLPEGVGEHRKTPRIGMAVLEDFHVLGKRLVMSALKVSGFSVLDLGSGLSPDELAERSVLEDIEILLVSTLMLPAALRVKDLRNALEQRGAHPRIVVGGAPFRLDPELWKEVGADAMGRDTAEAIRIVDTLCREARR